MTDSGVDSEPSPSSPDSDGPRSGSPSLMMTLLRRSSVSPPAACAVLRRREPPATSALLTNWRTADMADRTADEEEEKITLYRSEEECGDGETVVTTTPISPVMATVVEMKGRHNQPSGEEEESPADAEEDKMETVEALLSLSDSSRSPLASPEKQHSLATTLPDTGSLALTLPDTGSLATTLPDTGSLATTLPDTGSLATTLPDTGSLATTLPDTGSLATTLPDTGSLATTVPDTGSLATTLLDTGSLVTTH